MNVLVETKLKLVAIQQLKNKKELILSYFFDFVYDIMIVVNNIIMCYNMLDFK